MKLKIAGYVFDIANNYPYLEQFVSDYLTTAPADAFIESDVASLKKKQLQMPRHSLQYLEYLDIYRQITDFISARDGILMHGAVLSVDNNAYMFTAPSGTGKTTHIRQWQLLFKDRVTVINGDKPIIRLIDNSYIAYGTPWCGKERFNTNTSAPLKGIVLLSRGAQNTISQLPSHKLNSSLIKQVYLPSDSQSAVNVLDFVGKMFARVPLYHLHCNISTDAALLAYNAIAPKA